ncbi:hypothetical protein Barb4_02250 [Bacteroidales bacterium Barb4]|nr:hypothetical protein Barb4_02250 [Bacteroidales bacterium Barb4]
MGGVGTAVREKVIRGVKMDLYLSFPSVGTVEIIDVLGSIVGYRFIIKSG